MCPMLISAQYLYEYFTLVSTILMCALYSCSPYKGTKFVCSLYSSDHYTLIRPIPIVYNLYHINLYAPMSTILKCTLYSSYQYTHIRPMLSVQYSMKQFISYQIVRSYDEKIPFDTIAADQSIFLVRIKKTVTRGISS